MRTPTRTHLPLDHAVILLSNLEQNLPFYAALLPLLGFTRSREHVFANPDGIHLDFRQAREPDHGYHRHAPGLNHLGFTAPDRAAIERIAEAMAAAGFEVPEIQEFPDGSAIFFKDADGMRVEVGAYT
jgi:catechol 2,3-dioxygenase-like lactoylglutathione lyase family enzyme